MGRRSQRKEKRIKEWAACLKTKPDVIRSGWNQYISDPTNTDFTDYYKQEENFEGMRRHYSSATMRALDKGEWVYFQKLGPILQQGSCVHIKVGDQDGEEEEEEAHLRCARHRHRLTGNSH
jgi:hypothetical protein